MVSVVVVGWPFECSIEVDFRCGEQCHVGEVLKEGPVQVGPESEAAPLRFSVVVDIQLRKPSWRLCVGL